jgi:hypothetical protein
LLPINPAAPVTMYVMLFARLIYVSYAKAGRRVA